MDRTHTETAALTLPRWIPLALVLVTCALAVVFVLSTIEQDAPGPTP
jgi:TRAP-type C4-dicarboxylate transport system permease small subunit